MKYEIQVNGKTVLETDDSVVASLQLQNELEKSMQNMDEAKQEVTFLIHEEKKFIKITREVGDIVPPVVDEVR